MKTGGAEKAQPKFGAAELPATPRIRAQQKLDIPGPTLDSSLTPHGHKTGSQQANHHRPVARRMRAGQRGSVGTPAAMANVVIGQQCSRSWLPRDAARNAGFYNAKAGTARVREPPNGTRNSNFAQIDTQWSPNFAGQPIQLWLWRKTTWRRMAQVQHPSLRRSSKRCSTRSPRTNTNLLRARSLILFAAPSAKSRERSMLYATRISSRAAAAEPTSCFGPARSRTASRSWSRRRPGRLAAAAETSAIWRAGESPSKDEDGVEAEGGRAEEGERNGSVP